MLNRANGMLLVLLVIVVAISAATRVDYSVSNIEILPDMKYTPAWTAYRKNPVFANGRTLQAPVAGTIPRGLMPIHFKPTKEDALRAGEQLKNPYVQPSTPPSTQPSAPPSAPPNTQVNSLAKSVRRGAEMYRVFCVTCHGATGAGDGPVSKRGFPPPPSLLTGNSLKMKDGQLFHILTYGQGSMPDLAGQLSRQQRWDAINYVRSIQPKAGTSGDQAPGGDAADAKQPGGTEAAEADTPKTDNDKKNK